MRKRRNNKIMYVFLAIFVIFLALLAYVYFSAPLQFQAFQVKFNVVEGAIGFDVNSTALTFGNIFPGGTGVRTVIVDNKNSFPVNVKVVRSKSLENFLDVNYSIDVGAGKNYSLPFQIIVPLDTKPGSYKGEVRLMIFRKW